MFRSVFFKFLLVASIIAFMFCSKAPGVLQPEVVRYGSISGKIIHPDNNLIISVESEEGIDTTTRDPESQRFFFDSIKCGKCILQVRAKGYALFAQTLILDKPSYICHDIVLDQFPAKINFVYPPNSQYLDSSNLSISSPSFTDSGLWCFINFDDQMDTTSVNTALTLSPDTVGIQKIWTLNTSLSLYYTYMRLSTIDTVKVKIGRMALDQWGDTLERDFMIFYPVDTTYIRKAKVKPNSAPVIQAIISIPDTVQLGESCLIEVFAVDPDGDKLTYEWESPGIISGEGSTIFFTPNSCCGQPKVQVIVKDNKGGEKDTVITVPARDL